MSQHATLTEHQQLCDELHQLALDETRFLQMHQRAPDASLLERKRTLLARLEQSLAALRQLPAASVREPEARERLQKTRERILQILQLDKENERLLLRCSLAKGRSDEPTARPTSVAMLQKIYSQSA